MNWVDLKS